MKAVDLGIHQNISDNSGAREEGCRAIAKWQGRLKGINCKVVVTQVYTPKSEWPAPAS